MKNIVKSIICVLLLSQIGYAQKNTFNEDKLLERLEVLSSDKFEGRRTGEKGNDQARAYIINEFKNIGITGFNGSYEHSFDFEIRAGKFNAKNILAFIKGTEFPKKHIVISAHHDHLGKSGDKIYNGADDDASGVSALLAFAEYFMQNQPKHSVILAAFDAEELGLRGSKYFVDKMKDYDIVVNINMDMISRSAKNELYVVGTRYNKILEEVVTSFKNPTDTKLLIGHDGTDGKQNWTYTSDHGPFHRSKIPFLYFGNEDHAAYHKTTDEFTDVTPNFYKKAVKIIISLFKDLDLKGL